MTNVTMLTKELVEQFEFAVGRRVTAAEYMELRKQAIFELGSGYSVSMPTSQPDTSRPIMPGLMLQEQASVNPYNYALNNFDMNNYTQNMTSINPDPVVEQKVTPIETKAIMQSTSVPNQIPASEPVTKQPTTNKSAEIQAASTNEISNDNTDDFFKLVSKFS